MPAFEALGLMQEVRSMMTHGRTHHSSYEGQIIDKIDKAIAELEGNEVVDVRFSVHRRDLIDLLTEGGFSDVAPQITEETPTSTLLSWVLQIALYDEGNGPQLEGSYEILTQRED